VNRYDADEYFSAVESRTAPVLARTLGDSVAVEPNDKAVEAVETLRCPRSTLDCRCSRSNSRTSWWLHSVPEPIRVHSRTPFDDTGRNLQLTKGAWLSDSRWSPAAPLHGPPASPSPAVYSLTCSCRPLAVDSGDRHGTRSVHASPRATCRCPRRDSAGPALIVEVESIDDPISLSMAAV